MEGRPVKELVAAEAVGAVGTAVEAVEKGAAAMVAVLLEDLVKETGAREVLEAVSPRLRPRGRAI